MKSIMHHIKGVLKVIELLSKGKYLLYFIPGLLISILYYWASASVSGLNEGVSSLGGESWWNSALSTVASGAFSFIDWITYQAFIFIVLTVLSPFNTHLSEKMDTELTGDKFESGVIRIINDLIRMIFIVIIALILELILVGIWFVIAWIFGFHDTTFYTISSFLMGSFFFGFSFYDHSLERYQVGVFGSLGFAFKNMFMVTITGALFNLIYHIPFAGIALSPVLTTMVSTIVYMYYRGKLPVPIKQETTNE